MIEAEKSEIGANVLPSIFELIAQDSLSVSIQQAVRHIVKYLYERNPSRYRLLWKWYDEIYLTADLILQTFYLKKYGGSLAENFYGMKRIINGTCKSASTGFPKLRSLFMLVGWPYIMKKLEKIHLLLSTYTTTTNSRVNFMQLPLIHILVNYYPWIKILFSTFAFLLKIAYILSLCNVHSPELKFANVHLVKFTQIDIGEENKKRSWRVLAILASILTRCITFGLYFIQFLDFYYNSDTGENFRMEQRTRNWKFPPAPHKKLRESSVLLLETNKCPLCLRQRTNDTVLAVSGYVFVMVAYIRMWSKRRNVQLRVCQQMWMI
ncbi:Pex2/Pex12 amino terminal region family protein [Loa loa]|uniref:Peroxisome assembly protein 12 n=1 Tax=Loa loa TaxID=7209 RepID=A0A1S0U058_LOALO|nr:Pex2/Pex12 amino terminal region family protein [Loa loa]EFO23167.2 Pex2/Pex12 amino terminal region family protein [Loa loa]